MKLAPRAENLMERIALMANLVPRPLLEHNNLGMNIRHYDLPQRHRSPAAAPTQRTPT